MSFKKASFFSWSKRHQLIFNGRAKGQGLRLQQASWPYLCKISSLDSKNEFRRSSWWTSQINKPCSRHVNRKSHSSTYKINFERIGSSSWDKIDNENFIFTLLNMWSTFEQRSSPWYSSHDSNAKSCRGRIQE